MKGLTIHLAMFAGLLSLAAGSIGFAAERENLVPIRIDEAVAIAKKNNPEFRVALQRQRADAEKVNQAWGSLWPIIESEASVLRQGADSGFLSMSDGQYDIKVVQVKFGINPGMFYHTLQMTRKASAASSEEVRRIGSEIEQNVIESYFNLLLAEEMIRLRKETISLLNENLKDVTNLYRTGSVPKYDLLQAQVQLKSQEPLLIDAENKRRLAIEMFNYYLGLDERKYTADPSVLSRTEFPVAEDDIDAFVNRVGGVALKNRSEVMQLKIKKEIAGHVKWISRSLYLWPTFTAGGYYGYQRPLPNVSEAYIPTTGGFGYMDMSRIAGKDKWQPNWQVRIAATYRWGSLAPFDSSRSQAREAAAREGEAEEELRRVTRLITISLKATYANLITANRSIASHRENVEKAREGMRIARESYRAGVIKNAELAGAQVALTQAQAGYLNAVNAYYQSLAKLRREIGVADDSVIFGGKGDE